MLAPLTCGAPTDLPGERVTVTLADMGMSRMMFAPGHYELVCNLTNHYAIGMRQELIVTG